ncbi:MAG: hypothetical protein ACAI35_15910, partial [Candidatus Methylacidiphilales bacterium]
MPPLSLTQRIVIGVVGSLMVLLLISGAIYAGIYFASGGKPQQTAAVPEEEKVVPLDAKDLVVPLIPGAPSDMAPFQLNPERGDSLIAAKVKPSVPGPLDRNKSVIIALLDRENGPGARIESELAKALRGKALRQDASGGFTVKRYTLPQQREAAVEMIRQVVKD